MNDVTDHLHVYSLIFSLGRADINGTGKNSGVQMGILYDYAQRIERHIDENSLDVYKTRGAIAMRAGFIMTLVNPDDLDDPEKIRRLREAADEVLNLKLG